MDDIFVLRRIINQINTTAGTDFHLDNPSHNQLDTDFLSKISKSLDDLGNTFEEDSSKLFLTTYPCYENFKYKTGLSSVLRCGNGLIDKADNSVKSKIEWAKKLHTLTPKNELGACKELDELKKNLKKGKAIGIEVSNPEFLEYFFNEPEPSFKGSYNWLYTGGCISSIQQNNNFFLCCADTLCDSPVINFLKLNEDCNKVVDEQIFYLNTKEPILQVCLKKKDEDIIIGIRQNTRFTILSALNGRGNEIRKWKKSPSVDRILTSFDFSPTCEDVVISDADMTTRTVKIHKIETNQKPYKYKNHIRTAKDSWNKVLFREMDIFLTDRANFYIIDPRDGEKFSLQYSPLVRNEYECDLTCNMLISEMNPNFVYLATTHTVMQLDVRFPKPVQKWTHMMKHCPQHGNIVTEANDELILLQGMNLEDLVGIGNERIQEIEDVQMLSKSTPCLLKGMKNSVRVARYYELCLNATINKRFDSTVTGSCVIKDSNDIPHYFVTNAFGDVYGCKIKRRGDDQCDDLNDMLDSMKIYEEHFQGFNIGLDFDIPKITDMSHIFEKVEELGMTKNPKLNVKQPPGWKYEEMYAPESLKMYKDYLSKKITVVWGISNSDDEEVEEDEDDEIKVSDKVEGWLRKME